MKQRGILAGMMLIAAHVLASFKGVFSVRAHAEGGSQEICGGRDAFLSISSPRCHTQKKIYKGWAR